MLLYLNYVNVYQFFIIKDLNLQLFLILILFFLIDFILLSKNLCISCDYWSLLHDYGYAINYIFNK